jgi:hypothetical protein
MTIEERLEALERELSLTKAMLRRVLNESPATEIRARSITLTHDDGSDAATLRVLYEGGVPQGVSLKLADCCSNPSIELRDNVAGPQLYLCGDGRPVVQLGAVFEDPVFHEERCGLVIEDYRAALTLGSDQQACLYMRDKNGGIIWSAP